MKFINKYNTVVIAAAASLAFTSCNDFLDELPDNRMELKNKDEVSSILVSAYPTQWSAYLLETFSDNTDEYVKPGWTAVDLFQEEAWSWGKITSIDDETPQSLWDSYYSAVASANQALEFLESLSDKSEYKDQLCEAYLCRAYSMFKLSEIFCQAYDPATAGKELGLPYLLKPEKTIGEQYKRGTLEDLYDKIDKDIQNALPYVHNNYSAVKYHFNMQAAYAFASRFYLNYRKFDKTIDYATRVLGENPVLKLRDWKTLKSLSANQQIQPNEYVDSKHTANLMLVSNYSQWGVFAGPWNIGQKYSHGTKISEKETLESQGPWGSTTNNLGWKVFINNSLARHFARNIPYAFEYTDIQAGIGFAHSVQAEFTTDKLLMERAEAYALSGNLEAAIADMNTELSAFQVTGKTKLDLESIKKFYGGLKYYTAMEPTPKKEFHTSLVTDKENQEPVLQCLLHLKRILTIHEGLRLQDVKRYGITMYRRTLNEAQEVLEIKDTMEAGDPRLAIQIPADVVTAGLEPNPRNN